MSEFENAVMEDAWYELEGAYEVYGIGRYRFVISHCRTAIHIGLALLVRKKGRPASRIGTNVLNSLGMPEKLIDHCIEIERLGGTFAFRECGMDDPERSAAVLKGTLETFEWIRAEIDAL